MTSASVQPSRRVVLAGSTAAALGGVFAGFGAGRATASPSPAGSNTGENQPSYQEFDGKYQPGILSDAPAHAVFSGFNLSREGLSQAQSVARIRSILQMLTEDARRLMSGQGVLADTEPEMSQPASDLTITVGLGAKMLDLLGQRTQIVAELPKFSGEKLDPHYGQSDVLIQCCGQDPTVLHHAVRALQKNLRGITHKVFSQSGFTHAVQTARAGTGFRNLFGQIDGTNNPSGHARELAVFGDEENPSWTPSGTVLVLRRIKMNLDTWDEVDRQGRDFALGRRHSDGSPLSGSKLEDPVDLEATDQMGLPAIAAHAHVARAKPASGSEVLWRRGFNYHDSSGYGLIFASYQRNPHTSFIPVQQRLAQLDALNQWTTHVGSAVYAILPGAAPGEYLGQQLFSSSSGS